MGQKVLYREWRPMTFDEVVGQTHIVNALRYAVKSGELAHAYLFVGTRGTGKTSLAKIFARAVNCLHPTPEGNPCNECEICKGILDGSLLDVVEMDAASHNSVDNIRKITDEVLFLPTLAKYKVYIIDEVHMLSTQAFNALLKTLEEPPAHVIFIMATTDPQRILPTILSRCQRYDFKRIPARDMAERLALIASKHDIPIDESGIRTIVSRSEGALRDAISLLDQSRSVFSGKIGREEILAMTGVVNDELLEEIVLSLVSGDADRLLTAIDHLVMEGGDLQRFVTSLTKYFRDLLVCKTSRRPEELLQLPQHTLNTLQRLAPQYSQEDVIRQISHLTRLQKEMKEAADPRITLEVGLIQMLDRLKIRSRDALAAEEAARHEAASRSEDERKAAPERTASEAEERDAEDIPAEDAAEAEAEEEEEDDDDLITRAMEDYAAQEEEERRAARDRKRPEDESEEDGASDSEDEADDEGLTDLEAKLDAIDRFIIGEDDEAPAESEAEEAAGQRPEAPDERSAAEDSAEDEADKAAAPFEKDSPEEFSGLVLDFGREDTPEEDEAKAEAPAAEAEKGPDAEAEAAQSPERAEAETETEAAEDSAPAAKEKEEPLPEDFDPAELRGAFISRLSEREPLLGILLNSYPCRFEGRSLIFEVPAERRAIYDKIKDRKNQALLEQVFNQVKPAGEWHLSCRLAGGEEDEDPDDDPYELEWIKKMKRTAEELDIPLKREE